MDIGHGFHEVGSGRICEWGCSWRIWNDSRVSAIQYHEWAFLRSAVDAVVVRELSEREPVAPICLSVVDKDSEVLLDLLVHSFRLSIGLWVKGGGCVRGNVKHSVEFLHELRDELWASVRDNDLRHSMPCVYVVPKNPGPAFSGEFDVAGNRYDCL